MLTSADAPFEVVHKLKNKNCRFHGLLYGWYRLVGNRVRLSWNCPMYLLVLSLLTANDCSHVSFGSILIGVYGDEAQESRLQCEHLWSLQAKGS